ncbi:MAG: ligand-binding SRPBCC domain-containing protein [Algoriphagus sp.]|jgi:ligand-binding SRPBCC domain-containing protein
MKITIETSVHQDYLQVKEGFNEMLFKKLSPPFPPVKLLRFDGSTKGDLVTLELNFIFFKQKWTSEIMEDQTTDKEFYFIDKGIELPFFLKKWTHKHRIVKDGENSIIRDEIDYQAPFRILTLILYPAMLLQFAYRKPIYKKIFS